MTKSLFLILGNQLFDKAYLEKFKDSTFVMIEDYGLCTYEKHHKLKILHVLSSMRSHAESLKKNKYKVEYISCEKDFKRPYEEKLTKIIKKNKVEKILYFEIEDKPFEKKIHKLLKNLKLNSETISSPMFMNSRSDFKEYLRDHKRPFMANYYKRSRLKYDLLMENDKPLGGKWSFDTENRKKLPTSVSLPRKIGVEETKHTKELKPFINKHFKTHPGTTDYLWIPSTHKDAQIWLDDFIKNKLDLFGDYEDAVSQRDNVLFHSALSPLINVGLITPTQIIDKIKKLKRSVKLNSLEGYVRQVIGWREFMRGIYQEYSPQMEKDNFFKHDRRLTSAWYTGTTNIEPLDHSIKNAIKYGWTHHIERLMIISSLMNLCEIKPTLVYKWFMEMFIDSSEWVMVPNVYGMGLFSDGGIFATKPYICGSSYYLKMMDFKKDEWCETVDGLYWRFINKNRKFFSKNPRLNMMVSVYDKMNSDRKKRILKKANNFINTYTS